MEAFGAASSTGFEDRMVAHLRQCFPTHVEALGEQRTRAEITFGVGRAALYDLTSERDVCAFIDVMFGFGDGFDENPALPWARKILTRPGFPPRVRAHALHARAVEELKELALEPAGLKGRP